MKPTVSKIKILLILSCLTFSINFQAQTIPHLIKKGEATQLIVHDKPFLILGGELGNSSASDLNYMMDIWPKLTNMHLNTLLTPVYWELIEPEEGKFSFELIDGLILDARKNNIKLVLLWFGSWKNSMSCYAPAWIKTNPARFPRAKSKAGISQEIMSPFYEENLKADSKAYRALMKHLSVFDGKQNTVILMQVENEIGMLPDARDYSERATTFFNSQVPEDLIKYLLVNKSKLTPEIDNLWKTNSYKTSGSWEEIFGKSLATDELFMAWYYALYTEQVAAAGKAEYALPTYVNGALIREGYQPGQYPSAGPLPHLMNIWKAAAPSIDFLSPDIYFPNFEYWCEKYHQNGNPLFIPEANRELNPAMKAFYAIGAHDGMGFSPFSIESEGDPKSNPISKSYAILEQLAPSILENQGKGQITGFIFDKNTKETSIELGGYLLHIKHIFTLNWSPKAKENEWQMTGGIIICTAPGEYIVAGSGIVVTFEPAVKDGTIAGILSADEGTLENGNWNAGRRMNGDEDHQGRHIRIFEDNFEIQKVKLYTYK